MQTRWQQKTLQDARIELRNSTEQNKNSMLPHHDESLSSNTAWPEEAELRPGLSLVMLVHEPATQVAEIVRLFDGVADEVVVAVDSRVDPTTLGALESITHTLVRVEHEPPFARTAAWLHRLATRSWVFILDGDEVPSVALLSRLRGVHRIGRYATHARVGRRWLWPTPDRYLISGVWRENPALRLTPRDDRMLTWHTRLHDEVQVAGPAVFLPENLYHLDTALRTAQERSNKVEKYNQLDSALGEMNATWYLPESLPEPPQTAPVPLNDLAIIERVLAAREAPIVRATREFKLYTRDQVKAVVTGLPVDRTHQASLQPRDDRLSFAPASSETAFVAVRNEGNWTWRRPRDGVGVRVGWHWDNRDGTVLQYDAGRSDLPSDVPPGETVLVPLQLVAPSEPGSYVLRIGVVDELTTWFEGEALLPVDVGARVVLTFPRQEAEAVRQALRASHTYLEFGAGGSTMLAAETGVPQIMCVETDHDFLTHVSELVAERAAGVDYKPVAIDIGPTSSWGFPADDSGVKRWPQYTTVPWQRLNEMGWKPDLVLVDGRFRAACLLVALFHLEPGAKILFDDYGDRQHYWLVEQVLKPVSLYGRLALFEAPALSADALRIAANLLSQVLLDPR